MEAASTTEEPQETANASPSQLVAVSELISAGDEKSIFAYEGSEKTLSRAPGRPETVPFGGELITFMKDARRDSEVLTAKMMACYEKLTDLVALRDEFAEMFKEKYVGYEASTVFNTDKTGIYFDMPPSKTAF
ncbi:hypothetical protein PF008_g8218 [Phytophthora fragariae]|uniref:Uncharacterized protein n=1 Tax=Phytophthora fragariae TaxID=53985 RepID=A0A6G0S173_9STRA|nr:hypothetical protein PF008_g8218 [Phytophthora fragariae]